MSLLDLAPPHSVEAEQGVIGGLMLDNSAWDLIADMLSAEDFFRRDHRLIYQAIEKLVVRSSPIDVVTVFECLDDPDEVGGVGYLAELAKNTPSVANISTYASIVRERSHLRRLVMLGYTEHHHCWSQSDALKKHCGSNTKPKAREPRTGHRDPHLIGGQAKHDDGLAIKACRQKAQRSVWKV